MSKLLWALLPLSLLVGCVAEQSEPVMSVMPAPRPAIAKLTEPKLVGLGESVKGQPIIANVFNDGPRPVLILGGIHGDEVTSVDLTKNLIELLKRDVTLAGGKSVVIIPVANPDGYATNKRTNARGVDLNRNFPASNYRTVMQTKSPKGRYGASAASEPETRALLRALDTFNPRLIISIHSISDRRECNNYDGPAADVAQKMSLLNGYPVKDNIGYPTPGSMGTFCGIDRQIPMITLELPRGGSGTGAWARNKDALLTAIKAR
jgi:protein MpaA